MSLLALEDDRTELEDEVLLLTFYASIYTDRLRCFLSAFLVFLYD